MDRIFIEQLRVRGKHGVSEEERSQEQEFAVDISIDFDARKAAQSGALSDTINYDPIRAEAKEIVEKQSFLLIEKLAETIAQKVLLHDNVTNVTVTIRKTEVYSDCVPGVTITRTQ